MSASSAAGDYWRGLVALGPHAGAHRVALRAGLSVAIPLFALWAVGRLDWSLYAVFGAFASLYGRDLTLGRRARAQAAAGASLVGAVVLGAAVALLPGREWWAVPVAALGVAGVSVVARRGAWHPPGVLFQTFAFGACSSVPTAPGDVLVALALSGGTAVLAILIGLAGGSREPSADTAPQPPTASPRELAAEALRYGVAVAVAGLVATGLGIGHPYWAMVAAVVPLAAASTTGRLVRATQRLIGTGLGLGLAALLFAIDPTPLATIAIAVVLQVVAELLVGRNYSLALIAITPLALLMVHLGVATDPTVLLLDRAVETLVGLGVGVLVTVAAHQRPRPGLQ